MVVISEIFLYYSGVNFYEEHSGSKTATSPTLSQIRVYVVPEKGGKVSSASTIKYDVNCCIAYYFTTNWQ